MAGAIVLMGGDEFRSGCEEMDRNILASTGKESPRVIVVPTAAVGGVQKAADNGVEYFSSLGAQAEALMIRDGRQASDPQYVNRLRGASVLYFAGGSPDILLAALRGSTLLHRIITGIREDLTVVGSSAGAMVLGSQLRSPRTGNWAGGLGLVPNVAIFPHHERADKGETAGTETPDALTIVGIDSMTGCSISAGEWTVIGGGQVTVYSGGSPSVYTAGQSVPAIA